jgi:hypothetical protein
MVTTEIMNAALETAESKPAAELNLHPFREASLFLDPSRRRRKAVEVYRSPRRFANDGVVEFSDRSWSAPALPPSRRDGGWRFDRDVEWTTDLKPTEVHDPNQSSMIPGDPRCSSMFLDNPR